MPKLSVVIPCYNAEGNVPVTAKVVFAAEKDYPDNVTFEYIFIDDGSEDNTYEEILKVRKQYSDKVKVIKLTRNFGANNASFAGISHATGDCVSMLAIDLQDPPELIAEMYSYWQKGIKLVVANRANREEGLDRTITSGIYHFVMRMLIPGAPKGGFDLVLFDRQVRDQLVALDEKNAYIPYLLMWMGFPFVSIPYTRRKREIGQSMWTNSKKVKAFIDSVVAFSFAPIRIISISGLVLGAFALFYLIRILLLKAFSGSASIEGWSSLMVVLLGVGAFQMISLGIIGEYVWRSLDASRNRPNFIIDEKILEKEDPLLEKKIS